MNIFHKLFSKIKHREPEKHQLNRPYVVIDCSEPNKAKAKINGIEFEDGEKIYAKYKLDRWGTVTLVYRPFSSQNPHGWFVLDGYYEILSLDYMDCISKIKADENTPSKNK